MKLKKISCVNLKIPHTFFFQLCMMFIYLNKVHNQYHEIIIV